MIYKFYDKYLNLKELFSIGELQKIDYHRYRIELVSNGGARILVDIPVPYELRDGMGEKPIFNAKIESELENLKLSWGLIMNT